MLQPVVDFISGNFFSKQMGIDRHMAWHTKPTELPPAPWFKKLLEINLVSKDPEHVNMEKRLTQDFEPFARDQVREFFVFYMNNKALSG